MIATVSQSTIGVNSGLRCGEVDHIFKPVSARLARPHAPGPPAFATFPATAACLNGLPARVWAPQRGFQSYLRSSLSGIKDAAASFAPDSRSTARWRMVTA
jgi:hypothetical protein